MSSTKSVVKLINLQEPPSYAPAETISLKGHPHFNEAWLHEIIKSNPQIIGLGDLILRDHERRQPRAGRLDLLMEATNSNNRYEIEVQLGPTDESHIIRTIEYWDNEKKRYPHYEHRAVIIAEDITTRFLNVISLFNGHIPIIAIQVKAFKIQNQISLLFTKILNEVERGQEELPKELETNRNYWEEVKANSETVKLVDVLLEYIGSFAPGFQLKYNKIYIGLFQNNKAQNFVQFRPQKGGFRLDIGCRIPDEFRTVLEGGGLNVGEFADNHGVHPIYLSKDDVYSKKGIIIKALQFAYDNYFS